MKPITKAEAKKKYRKFWNTEIDKYLPNANYKLKEAIKFSGNKFSDIICDEIYDSLKELKMEEVEIDIEIPDTLHRNTGFNQAVKEINLKIDNLCLNTKQ